MSQRSRLGVEWTILCAALACFAGAAAYDGWFARLDTALYDTAFALARRPAAQDIVIVGIDESSLAQLGRWPWRRAIHATMLPHLAQARAVLLDVILAEPDANDVRGEQLLSQAIARNGRVVLTIHAGSRLDGSLAPVTPNVLQAGAAAALGHIHVDLDADGIARRVFLHEGSPNRLWPHVAVAMRDVAARAGGERPASALPPTTSTDAAPFSPGWTRRDEFPIAFVGPAGTFDAIPYVAVLRGDVADDFFRDKYVVVGSTAVGMGDTFVTPAADAHNLMSGAEVIANVLQQLNEGIAVRTFGPVALAALSIALLALVFAVGASLSEGARLGVTAIGAFGLPLAAVLYLARAHVWVPPSAASVAVLATYPLWSWRRLAAAQSFLDRELARLRSALPDSSQPRRRGDPLAERIAAIQAANDGLRRRAEERDQTISFLSHDMRAPQASVLALADYYRDVRHGVVDARFWERLEGHARETLSLADDFVQIARAERLPQDALEPVNLAQLMLDAVDNAWPALNGKAVTAQKEVPPDAWTLGDRGLIARAFGNLIDNAIKHSPPASKIAIAVEERGGEWLCSVADEGPGVPVALREAIFERYRVARSDGDDAGKSGAGLGLALVRTVAERFGGAVAVHDAPGGGACFVIRLPAVAAPQ